VQVLLGRVKPVQVSYGGPAKQPTPNYDTHMTQSPALDENKYSIVQKSQASAFALNSSVTFTMSLCVSVCDKCRLESYVILNSCVTDLPVRVH
jgi:hypothetical protein